MAYVSEDEFKLFIRPYTVDGWKTLTSGSLSLNAILDDASGVCDSFWLAKGYTVPTVADSLTKTCVKHIAAVQLYLALGKEVPPDLKNDRDYWIAILRDELTRNTNANAAQGTYQRPGGVSFSSGSIPRLNGPSQRGRFT